MTHRRAHNFPARRRRRGGFTMIEAAAATVIGSVMIAAALTGVAASAKQAYVQKDQARAVTLARQLLEEIAQQSYANPGGNNVFGAEAGETRAGYDDVDDYHGLSESPPADRAGAAIPGFTGWTRAVAVEWVDPANPATVATSDLGLKRVTVTVTSPRGRVTKLAGLRSQYGLYEKPAPTSTQVTFPSYVSIRLQTGGDSAATVTGAVSPVNQWP